MKISIITLFPEMFESVFNSSILKRAQQDGKLEIEVVNLRQFGIGTHKIVDDKPYGGGVGMVLRADVVVPAIQAIKKSEEAIVILMEPKGQQFSQSLAEQFSKKSHIILVCGHYEGFDERIREYADLEVSLGDFVLSGGEIAAMAITEAVARLSPGVLSKEEAHQRESFSNMDGNRFLEHPHYTRPAEFEGKKVPETLLSGHRENIETFRKEESIRETKHRRPDILKT